MKWSPLRSHKSEYANESESEEGAEIGSATPTGGCTTSPQWLHVSPVSVSGSGIGTVIGTGTETETETETALGRESEIGIGHLVVVVGTVARAVRAVAVEVAVVVVVVVVVEAEAEAGMVEAATATATGHWLREWDSEILLSGFRRPPNTIGRTYMNSQPLPGPANF